VCLDSNSISEYVMPSIPAIFLYASSTEHFSLGGMHTLFKTRIHPWVDETIADVRSACTTPCVNMRTVPATRVST